MERATINTTLTTNDMPKERLYIKETQEEILRQLVLSQIGDVYYEIISVDVEEVPYNDSVKLSYKVDVDMTRKSFN